MRNVNENSPDVGGIFLILTPPISNDVQVFSGGLGAVGRPIGATVAEGWSACMDTVLGDPLRVACEAETCGEDESPSFVPLVSGGFTAFGFVIGIADF